MRSRENIQSSGNRVAAAKPFFNKGPEGGFFFKEKVSFTDGMIQPYRNKSAFNFGKADGGGMVEDSFNKSDKEKKPWIQNITITFTGKKKDADGNDTWNGTVDVSYYPNAVALSGFSFAISGGSVQVGNTDAGTFTVHRIEGISYNSGKYSDLTDGVGPGKRYTKNLGPANMHFAVFYNGGEAIHLGPLGDSSHGCVHVDPGDAIKMRQINYHSVIGRTKVKVVYA
ncbi:MAG: L,D-transpeptidase [Bacteroidia bacterium]